MSNGCCNKKKDCCSHHEESEKKVEALDIDAELKRRPRSPTLLNLSWLKERLDKVKRIKESLSSSNYKVDPEETAKAMLNEDKE